MRVYLSEYLEAYRNEYYGALLNISQNNNREGWINFFLQAVTEQSKENINKAKKIIALYEQKKQRITELTKPQFSIKILDALFVMPIFQSKDFIKTSGIPRDSAFKLSELAEYYYSQAQIQQKITESFKLLKQSKHLLGCAKRAVEKVGKSEEKAEKWLTYEVK